MTLEQRLTALVAAVGADIKALQSGSAPRYQKTTLNATTAGAKQNVAVPTWAKYMHLYMLGGGGGGGGGQSGATTIHRLGGGGGAGGNCFVGWFQLKAASDYPSRTVNWQGLNGGRFWEYASLDIAVGLGGAGSTGAAASTSTTAQNPTGGASGGDTQLFPPAQTLYVVNASGGTSSFSSGPGIGGTSGQEGTRKGGFGAWGTRSAVSYALFEPYSHNPGTGTNGQDSFGGAGPGGGGGSSWSSTNGGFSLRTPGSPGDPQFPVGVGGLGSSVAGGNGAAGGLGAGGGGGAASNATTLAGGNGGAGGNGIAIVEFFA